MNRSTKPSKLATAWDNTDKWVKRIIGAIATVGTIIGILTSMTSWLAAQLDTHLDSKLGTIINQIETLDAKSDEADRKLELSNTRLELMQLIEHNPTNVIEIEKVARYYFIDLGGDWYMSNIYSEWAKEYGGDLTFVTHI